MDQTARDNPNPAGGRTEHRRSLDVCLALLLFAAAFGVRCAWKAAIVFPPSEEAAFYLVSAEQLTAGRGLEIDVLWTYQTGFENVTHPSHEFWMPLVTALVSAALAVQQSLSGGLSDVWNLAQMSGVVLGALLAPLTYLLGRRALPGAEGMHPEKWTGNRWVSLGASVLVLASPVLAHQSVGAGSDAPFGLWAAWALMTAVRRPGDQGGYLGTGLLVGLAFLTHTEGLWLLLAVPLAWWLLPDPRLTRWSEDGETADIPPRKHWPREKESAEEWRRPRGPSPRHTLDLFVAFAILAGPWLMRNYLTFGSPLPQMLAGNLWLTDPVDRFGYFAQPTAQAWLAQGLPELVQRWRQALLLNAGLLVSSTFPWLILALAGLWLLRRTWTFVPFLIYGALVAIGAALILPVSSMSGSMTRSLGGMIPFLALAAMYALQRLVQRIKRFRRAAIAVAVVTVFLFLLQAGITARAALPIISEHSQSERERLEEAAAWLEERAPADGVVMTNRGYALNYASGHPTIALPGNESTEAVWTAAQRYGAEFLVIIGSYGQYPMVLEDRPDTRFEPVAAGEGYQVFRVTGAQH